LAEERNQEEEMVEDDDRDEISIAVTRNVLDSGVKGKSEQISDDA